jgi:hypothetical protein
MKPIKHSLYEQLEIFRAIIDSVKENKLINEAVKEFGYDDVMIDAVYELLENTEEAFFKVKSNCPQKFEASEELNYAQDLLIYEFSNFSKILTQAFKKRYDLLALIPVTPIFPFRLWCKDVKVFYQSLMQYSIIVPSLINFGIDKLSLLEKIEEINKIHELYRRREKELEDFPCLASNRNRLFDELKQYCFDFNMIAQIALNDIHFFDTKPSSNAD